MTDRELTRYQRAALDTLLDEDGNEDAKIVGWDTSCDGPLVRLNSFGFTVAITPRGRTIERNPA